MRLFFVALSLFFLPCLHLQAQEAESVAITAKTCEKALKGESPSSVRVRAVDKAVFLGLKNLDVFEQDKAFLSDHDLNVMIYRLVDDYVEDLSSKVVRSEEGKVCVEISGYINPQNIELVRNDFKDKKETSPNDDRDDVAKIAEEVQSDLALVPQKAEDLALVYVDELEYYNKKRSLKYALFLKDLIKDNPYYFLTDQKDIADYIIFPKVLKAKVDLLDPTHKRIQMVVVLEISKQNDDIKSISQNRFLLFSAEENEQDIASRLIKKLLQAAAQDAVRYIERKEQIKLEQNVLGRDSSSDVF